MISGISGVMSSVQPQSQGGGSLSDAQLQLISDTLGQYDPDNLSTTDAQSIVSTFSEAGIQPGKALASAMAEFGFDAKAVGDAAGMQPPPPPQGAGSGGLNIDQESLQQLVDMLDQAMSGDLSEADSRSLLQTIRENLVPEGGLFNAQA